MTKRRRIHVFDRAEQDIREAAQWWQENRPDAPNVFREELRRVFKLLSRRPHVGTLTHKPSLRGIRRIYVGRIRYHLYYRVKLSTIEVLALWHASRESGPHL